jgi:quinol monooxygenase YgiN
MAVAVQITPEHMSRADYERLITELKSLGVDQPQGRRSHVAYGEDEVRMFETWDSADDFDAHRGSLMRALRAVALESCSVELHAMQSPLPD